MSDEPEAFPFAVLMMNLSAAAAVVRADALTSQSTRLSPLVHVAATSPGQV